jgi:ankyrin repeat protein
MVRFLLGCGADIETQRHDGETALMIAITNSDSGMVYLLARLVTKFSLTNKKDQNAIDLAQIYGSEQIEQMIIERKAGIELP